MKNIYKILSMIAIFIVGVFGFVKVTLACQTNLSSIEEYNNRNIKYELTIPAEDTFHVTTSLVYNIPNEENHYEYSLTENNSNISQESINESLEDTAVEEINAVEEIDIISYVINLYGEETVEALTSLLWGESRGIPSKSHKAGTIWVVLNRYDTGNFGNSILEVATAKNQFYGYKKNRVYSDINLYNECKDLVIDVLYRYTLEKNGDTNVGRTLPASYLYFVGNGKENLYTEKWKSKKYWDWSLPNPYDE